MKYYIFYKEDNDFTEILTDQNLKKSFKFKVTWSQHLMLGSFSVTEEIQSYIVLKYGESLVNDRNLFINRKPIANKDYLVSRNIPDVKQR